jgi:hypothetical protein
MRLGGSLRVAAVGLDLLDGCHDFLPDSKLAGERAGLRLVSGLSGLDSAQEKSKVRVTDYPGGDLFEENVVLIYVAERRNAQQ